MRPEREGHQRPKQIVRSSGDSGEPAHSIGTWTKETPTDSFLNERERLLGLMCFGFGCLRTELHRRQPIFGSFDTRLSLRQGSRRVLQLALGLRDEFTSRPLGGFSSHFRELQSFHGALTEGLGARFGLLSFILDAAENLGGLIYEIESCLTAIGY
jgi:hypothetical protein